MARALAHLQQATSVAARYQLSAWHLRMHFIEAILTLPIPLGGAEDAVKASLPFPQCMSSHLWTQVLAGPNVSTPTFTICLC